MKSITLARLLSGFCLHRVQCSPSVFSGLRQRLSGRGEQRHPPLCSLLHPACDIIASRVSTTGARGAAAVEQCARAPLPRIQQQQRTESALHIGRFSEAPHRCGRRSHLDTAVICCSARLLSPRLDFQAFLCEYPSGSPWTRQSARVLIVLIVMVLARSYQDDDGFMCCGKNQLWSGCRQRLVRLAVFTRCASALFLTHSAFEPLNHV